MEEVDNEIEKISPEYKYVQVKTVGSVIDRISDLVSAVPSRDDRAMAEVYVDLNDYCELGDSDPLVDKIQELHKDINLIVFYA